MANLKDQIQQEIREKRERTRSGQADNRSGGGNNNELEQIRPRLDELAHADDKYSIRVDYAVGPYSADIGIIELYDAKEAWVASWQIASTVGGSVEKWEITYNPHGVDTQHKWFRDTDGLFSFLTTSIAERIVEMESGE